MLAFRLTERKDNVNCYAQCLTAMEVPLSPSPTYLYLCVCHHQHGGGVGAAPLLRSPA